MILLIESNMNSEVQKKKFSAKIEPYLENFQIPREIIILPEFNRTLNGEIQRKATLASLTEKE
jgi:acyl-CoA synthetase (AMP-forming)/AMP-acid ligase II